MKLIIQIPAYNEADTLAVTLKELPRVVTGFETVEWLVIDDGSNDETMDVARANGADHIVRHTQNLGLARAFMTGLNACVEKGADVIVNTDADNQYNAADIPLLVQPILEKKAEIVVGERPIAVVEHFSTAKKILQKVGSWVVRIVSGTDIPDAPSGFRAMSKNAALQLNVFNSYTYTLETIIQAGQKKIGIVSVPIRVNEDLRPSRLVRSTTFYVKQSIVTIVRIFVVYKPFRFFLTIALLTLAAGLLLGFRFLYYYLSGDGSGHVQSVILAGVLIGLGFQTVLVAFLADIIAVNRRLMEDIRYILRKKQ